MVYCPASLVAAPRWVPFTATDTPVKGVLSAALVTAPIMVCCTTGATTCRAVCTLFAATAGPASKAAASGRNVKRILPRCVLINCWFIVLFIWYIIHCGSFIFFDSLSANSLYGFNWPQWIASQSLTIGDTANSQPNN